MAQFVIHNVNTADDMTYSEPVVITIRVPLWEHVMVITTIDEILRKEGVISNGLREHTGCDKEESIEYATDNWVELPLKTKSFLVACPAKDCNWQFGGTSSQFRSTLEFSFHAVTWWSFRTTETRISAIQYTFKLTSGPLVFLCITPDVCVILIIGHPKNPWKQKKFEMLWNKDLLKTNFGYFLTIQLIILTFCHVLLYHIDGLVLDCSLCLNTLKPRHVGCYLNDKLIVVCGSCLVFIQISLKFALVL